ncbi:DUF6063 family protein [Piscibacillus sp. B03]|uniref:DUF6063 family protein n=1 Tax=Piscibacillus sp. B03 TaxID=3457430 RepID=UPI003FCDBCB2
MDVETMKIASNIFFTLLDQKVLTDEDERFKQYSEPDVRSAVNVMADESKTYIIETQTKLHLVTKPDGSVFATHFSHLKSKYPDVENKKKFNLISMIIMTYLAEIDQSVASKWKRKREGITYYVIEQQVSKLIQQWEQTLNENPEFSKEKGIAMNEIITLWHNLETLDERDQRPNRRTRIGIIMTAMKLLKDEGLVHITEMEDIHHIFPKDELFERVESYYQNQRRYQEVKQLILEGSE